MLDWFATALFLTAITLLILFGVYSFWSRSAVEWSNNKSFSMSDPVSFMFRLEVKLKPILRRFSLTTTTKATPFFLSLGEDALL